MKKDIDWHSAALGPWTPITSSYKNTQNVRRFFKKEIGAHFHFNRPFMKYLKETPGITLGDAVNEWKLKNE
jgi:Domain of unknown function (DUF6434)